MKYIHFEVLYLQAFLTRLLQEKQFTQCYWYNALYALLWANFLTSYSLAVTLQASPRIKERKKTTLIIIVL